MEKYKILKQVGKGTFGIVYKGIQLDTNQPIAIKIEKDKPELLSTSLKAGEITLTPNFEAMRKAFKEKKSKLVRVHVNLTKVHQGKKKYQAIIALRINNCIK